jgi:hypothetical protein
MSIYGGKTYDENGYRPFLMRFLGREQMSVMEILQKPTVLAIRIPKWVIIGGSQCGAANPQSVGRSGGYQMRAQL